ncbi:phosphoadenosine phosphosulfate reductase family protein [Fibrobacter sp. UWB11]|uniref:phosphoadenosine phosphosulfate reductase domain-containing protein n=1 Tax=Fibrobacter sp. UWB11 TaxID=1896202 RepID=UPI0009271CB3|nr:phosphoadenosine phosphosulfate reductase [Fibrobacter sp. UWB11]
MWCKNCNIETKMTKCPVCGSSTSEEVASEVYWCDKCKAPVIYDAMQLNKGVCPICHGKTKYMAQDVRPVFPEERLLLELLLGLTPHSLQEKSIWCENSRYFIDGNPKPISSSVFQHADTDMLREGIESSLPQLSYAYFDKFVEAFCRANRARLDFLKNEAFEFVRKEASKYKEEKIVLSFSGGKDSTVTADLVQKALSNPSLVHIFGNTTLEFDSTVDYAKRYQKDHPYAIFLTAKNTDQVFEDVVEDIGPPARMMRWCCSMFKTGPITRILNSLYKSDQILTFYGIRKVESISRSKYNRVEKGSESVKIQKQTVASPIFFWTDVDVWLYMLAEKVDFNDAYRKGYDRVGCWCCPNNNQRAQFLSRIYMPDKSKAWRTKLISFAKKIGKPDPEEYVDSGKWKARQGGNGLAAANDVKVKFTNCTAEDHAKIYSLKEPCSDAFINLFVPFGKISKELGRKLLHEVLVLDIKTNVPIISIQPFSNDGFEFAVKIKTMNVDNHDFLQTQISYQVKKFNACRKCLKCESICKANAISITVDGYHIDPFKCVHCKKCVTAKYLAGGCLMNKYLKTKPGK